MLGIVIPVYNAPSLDNTMKWIKSHVTVKHRIVVVEHYRGDKPPQQKDCTHIQVNKLYKYSERGTGSRLGIEELLKDSRVMCITDLDHDGAQDLTDINNDYNSILQNSGVIIKSRRLSSSEHDRPWPRLLLTNTFGTVNRMWFGGHVHDWSHTHRYYCPSILRQVGLPSSTIHSPLWNFSLLVKLIRAGVPVRETACKLHDHNASSIRIRDFVNYIKDYIKVICNV